MDRFSRRLVLSLACWMPTALQAQVRPVGSAPLQTGRPIPTTPVVVIAPPQWPHTPLAAPSALPSVSDALLPAAPPAAGQAAPPAVPAAPVPEPWSLEARMPFTEAALPGRAAPRALSPADDDEQNPWSFEHWREFFDGLIPESGHPDSGKDAESLSAEADDAAPDGAVRGRPLAQAVRPARFGYEPYAEPPVAVLPDGTALPPDTFTGGYHGTDIDPETVVRQKGFPARSLFEDWRLYQHSEEKSEPVSAFRGATDHVSMPGDNPSGAAYWADDGGWVYDIRGVPTWDLNTDLDGRVRRPDGTYRGNLMHGEAEQAVPAHIPLECIRRWGQVASHNGSPYVPHDGWRENPRYDALVCAQFWGAR
ncbi:MAG: hypothetical protein HY927_05660 [Elusimicrobia bacterium]|nr:hypothetical protein [Elusimicrobiota bacterium]